MRGNVRDGLTPVPERRPSRAESLQNLFAAPGACRGSPVGGTGLLILVRIRSHRLNLQLLRNY
jgi:hypothetical protein